MDSKKGATRTRLPTFDGTGPVGRAMVAVFAVLVAAGCAEEEPTGQRAAPVEGAAARMDTLSVTVEAVGSLEARSRVEVKPEIAGRVSEILFDEGDSVRAGQVLVRLDRGRLAAELSAARASVSRARVEAENLERQLRRNDSLLARGAISEQAYDDLETSYASAQAGLEEAEANLALARENLEDATIRAPFDGRVGVRSFDPGDYLAVGTSMFTVVDDDPLEIRFSVPERYLGQLELGSEIDVRVQSAPDRTVEGQLEFVSPYVNAASRSVELRALIPNADAVLRPGQFATVELQLEERPAVLVPEAALLPREEGATVFLVRGGAATPREVTMGLRRQGVVEILSGVSPGDTVVVAGQQRLEEGTAVAVTMTGSEPSRAGATPAGGDGDTTEAASDGGRADSTDASEGESGGTTDAAADGASADNA